MALVISTRKVSGLFRRALMKLVLSDGGGVISYEMKIMADLEAYEGSALAHWCEPECLTSQGEKAGYRPE